jgi:hypothetical protein
VTTSTAVSPFVVSDVEVVELSDDKGKRKLWKKQILPAGTRKYKGNELDFSKINPAVLKAFDEKAFDAVPFVMSLTSNEHPQVGQEGELIEGDLDKLELADDGSLYGYFDLSHSYKVLNAIRKSRGKFGVSGRIEVDYTAPDSDKHFDYALSHVCGTTRPHLKGMVGWTPVDLSEADKEREVIDFSGEVIDEPTTTKETGDDLVAVEIPKEKLDKLLALLDYEEDAIEETADDIEKKTEVELPDAVKEQIAAAEKASKDALQLAETMQVDAAKTRWDAERAILLSEGVPPAILDLAGKVLGRHKPVTLEFAEGDIVDATEVVRNILDESKGFVDLGEERGHSFRETDTPENREYTRLEEAFSAMWNADGRDR